MSRGYATRACYCASFRDARHLRPRSLGQQSSPTARPPDRGSPRHLPGGHRDRVRRHSI